MLCLRNLGDITTIFFIKTTVVVVKWEAVMSAERESARLAESTRGQGMIPDTWSYIARNNDSIKADGGVASIAYACAE